MVCDTCLRLLVYKGETPKWFVGKKVKDFTEYRDLNLEYGKLSKKEGGHIHCCDKDLHAACIIIEEQVKRVEYDRDEKANWIILKERTCFFE